MLSPKLKNRVGEKFGKLTIIKELGENKILCRCECGREKVLYKSNVVSGKQTSCGECKTEHPKKRRDISGMRFGRLVAISPIGPSRDSILWKCKCDCGNETEATVEQLQSGDKRSCGCLEKESRSRVMKEKQFQGTNISKISSTRAYASSKTGVRGISKKKNRYVAYITVKKKRINLGSFPTIEEAAKARKRGEEKYFSSIIEEYQKEKK